MARPSESVSEGGCQMSMSNLAGSSGNSIPGGVLSRHFIYLLRFNLLDSERNDGQFPDLMCTSDAVSFLFNLC